MSPPKAPIDLRAVVQTRLTQLTFVKRLRLRAVPMKECSAITEGTSADFAQGVRLNEGVAIFLDWWGYGRPHNRYSFAVFEQDDDGWQQVQSRLEDIDRAVAIAIHALTLRALLSSKAKS